MSSVRLPSTHRLSATSIVTPPTAMAKKSRSRQDSSCYGEGGGSAQGQGSARDRCIPAARVCVGRGVERARVRADGVEWAGVRAVGWFERGEGNGGLAWLHALAKTPWRGLAPAVRSLVCIIPRHAATRFISATEQLLRLKTQGLGRKGSRACC